METPVECEFELFQEPKEPWSQRDNLLKFEVLDSGSSFTHSMNWLLASTWLRIFAECFCHVDSSELDHSTHIDSGEHTFTQVQMKWNDSIFELVKPINFHFWFLTLSIH